MSPGELKFYGLEMGSDLLDLLPRDLLLPDLDGIRRWAMGEGLITDIDFQVLTPERIQELAKNFSSDDRLIVAATVQDIGGESCYMEYPSLPVRSLIRRAEEVGIVYWRVVPTQWDAEGNVLHFGEVRFGFWYPGCTEELCSLSNAKRITHKFDSLLVQLFGAYDVRSFSDGAKEITVDGAVRAKFFKEGRYFDVALRLAEG